MTRFAFRVFRTSQERRDTTTDRRDRLNALALCINGPDSARPSLRSGIVHGPVVSGGKCARCIARHKGQTCGTAQEVSS